MSPAHDEILNDVRWTKTIKNIRKSEFAVLTDGRDKRGHRLISILRTPKLTRLQRLNQSRRPFSDLRKVVQYLSSFVDASDVLRGVSVVADLSDRGEAELDALCEVVNYVTKNDVRIASAFIVRPKQNQSCLNATRKKSANISPTYFQVHLLESVDSLQQYVSREELLPQLGGTKIFNISDFITFVETFDKFEFYTSSVLNKALLYHEEIKLKAANDFRKSKNVYPNTIENSHPIPARRFQSNPLTRFSEPVGSIPSELQTGRTCVGELEEAISQCKRIKDKFNNCEKYDGLKELRDHPALEKAILVLENRQAKLEWTLALLGGQIDLQPVPKNQSYRDLYSVLKDKTENVEPMNEPRLQEMPNDDDSSSEHQRKRISTPPPKSFQPEDYMIHKQNIENTRKVNDVDLARTESMYQAEEISLDNNLLIASRPPTQYDVDDTLVDSVSIATITTISVEEGSMRYDEVEPIKETPKSFSEIEASGVVTLLALAKKKKEGSLRSGNTDDDENRLIRSRIMQSFKVANNLRSHSPNTTSLESNSNTFITNELPINTSFNKDDLSPVKPARKNMISQNMPDIHKYENESTNIKLELVSNRASEDSEIVFQDRPNVITNRKEDHQLLQEQHEQKTQDQQQEQHKQKEQEQHQEQPLPVKRHRSIEKIAAFNQMMKDYLERKRKSSFAHAKLREETTSDVESGIESRKNKSLPNSGEMLYGIVGDKDVLVDCLRKDLFEDRPPGGCESKSTKNAELLEKHKDNLCFLTVSHELKPYRKRLLMSQKDEISNIEIADQWQKQTIDQNLSSSREYPRRKKSASSYFEEYTNRAFRNDDENVYNKPKDDHMIEGIDIETWLGVSGGSKYPSLSRSDIKRRETAIDEEFAKEIKLLQDIALSDMARDRTTKPTTTTTTTATTDLQPSRSFDRLQFCRQLSSPSNLLENQYDYPSKSRRFHSSVLVNDAYDYDRGKGFDSSTVPRFADYYRSDAMRRYSPVYAIPTPLGYYNNNIPTPPHSRYFAAGRLTDFVELKTTNNKIADSPIYSIPVNWGGGGTRFPDYDAGNGGNQLLEGVGSRVRYGSEKPAENVSVFSEESGVWTLDTESNRR